MKKIAVILALFFCANTFAQNGDSDGDGVLDRDDVCPDVKGTAQNKGCPAEKKVEENLYKTILTIIEEGKKNFLFSEYVLEELPNKNQFGGEEDGDKNYKFGLTLGGDAEYIRYVSKLKRKVFFSDFYGLDEKSLTQAAYVKTILELIFNEFEKKPGYSLLREKNMVTLYDSNKVVVISYWMNDDKSLLAVTTR